VAEQVVYAGPEGALPPPADRVPISLGMPVASYLHGVAWIADEAGFFEQHGIEVAISTFGGAQALNTQFAEGRIDVALCSGTRVIHANIAGADLAIFAGLVNRIAHRIFTMDDVETPRDLVGKTVGVPVRGTPQDWAFRVLMHRSGLDHQDLVIRAMGGLADFQGALERGEISAVASTRPPRFIEGRGGRVLAEVSEWDLPFPFLVLAADRAWLEERREATLALTRAFCDGIRFYKDHGPESLEILKPHLAGSLASVPGMERAHYEAGGPHLFSSPPFPDLEGVAWVLSQLRAGEQVSIEDYAAADFMESGIIRQLEREGFFSNDEEPADGG